MKKLLILILFAFSLNSFNQELRLIDTLQVSTGTDTLYVFTISEKPLGVLIDYRNFDAADGTLDVGYTYDYSGTILCSFNTTIFPVTLADSALHVERYYNTAPFVYLKLTKGSNTAGLKAPIKIYQ